SAFYLCVLRSSTAPWPKGSSQIWTVLLTLSSFFFSSRRRHTIFSRDWSSGVCSSDLGRARPARKGILPEDGRQGKEQGGLGQELSQKAPLRPMAATKVETGPVAAERSGANGIISLSDVVRRLHGSALSRRSTIVMASRWRSSDVQASAGYPATWRPVPGASQRGGSS